MSCLTMRRIEITAHAKQRFAERMPDINPKDYSAVAQSARYRGKTKSQLLISDPQFATALFKRFRGDNSTEIRVYKNHIFIFCGNKGHSRTLKTVVDIPQYILALKNT